MSSENKDPEVIIAAGLGANKGFWMVQLRDRLGQFAEMGRFQLMLARLKRGLPPVPINGKYIGASDKIKGFARILIEGFGDKGFKDGVYHVPTSKMESFEALIPKEDLIRQGIQPGQKLDSQGNPIISREWSEKDFLDYENTLVDPITDADRELADATPTDEEKQIIEEERAKSPLAKLPPGAEADMTEEELARIIENTPSEMPEPAPTGELTPEERQANIDAWREFGREHAIYRKVAGEKNKKKETKARRAELESKYPIFKADEALKDKLDSLPNVTENQEKIKELKDARKLLNERTINSLKSGDESPTSELPYNFDDLLAETPEEAPSVVGDEIDSAVGKAIKDAMDGKPVDVDQIVETAKKSRVRRGGKPPEPTDEGKEPTPPKTDGDSPLNIPESQLGSDPLKDPENSGKPFVEPTIEELQKAFDVVEKMSEEELDKLIANEDFTQDTGGFEPSSEQKRAIAAMAFARVDTVIDALAGCGKTATAVSIARVMARLHPDVGILVLTFGRRNADDARRRIPRENCRASTTHKIARDALSPKQKGAMQPGIWNQKVSGIIFKTEALAEHLEIDDTPGPRSENIDAEDGAILTKKIINAFCQTGDREITKEHVLKAFSDHFDMSIQELTGGTEEFPEPTYKINYDKWLGFANKFWEDVSQKDFQIGRWDKQKQKFIGKKRIRIEHDHYLKLWQLSNPDLSKIKVGKKRVPVGLVIVDEAQDTNGTVVDVLNTNKGKVQRAWIGDTNQNIFGWRGAKNALKDAKSEAPAVQNLTTTYRMPETMVGPGNGFLNLLGDDKRIVGNPDIDPSTVTGIVENMDDLPFGPGRAHLTRTNLEAAKEIVKFIEEGKKVGAISQLYKEIKSNYYYIEWLKQDFKTRTKKATFPDGREIEDSDFKGINTFTEFKTRAERDPKSLVGRWYTFATFQGGKDYIALGKVIDNLSVDKSDVGDGVDSLLDSELGSDGLIWISKEGRELRYEVDDYGTLFISGDATKGEVVNGAPLKDELKKRGFRWNPYYGENGGWEARLPDEDDRKTELDSIAAFIPNRLEANEEKLDVILSTAHRAKGLEWKYVSLGEDFYDINDSDPKKRQRARNEEELRTGYVAVTRAERGMYLGSLSWIRQFEGRDGLSEANNQFGRPDDFGVAGWEYKEKLEEEAKKNKAEKAASKPKLSSSLGSTGRNGKINVEQGPASIIPQGVPTSRGGASTPKNFLDDWQQIGSGKKVQYSKLVDGVRWEITLNKDGTALLRNRSDSSAPSKKYDNLQDLIKDFGNSRSEGIKNNREIAKSKLDKYDPNGALKKLIDSGANGDTVLDELFKNPDFVTDLRNGDVAINSIVAAIEKLNNGRSISSKNSPKLKKPKKATKAIPVTVAPSAPTHQADIYVNNPGRHDSGSDISGIVTASIDPRWFSGAKVNTIEEMQNAILKIHPGATIKPDGSIVWFRKKMNVEPKESKDFSKQKVSLEVGLIPSQNGTMKVYVKVTNLDSQQSKTYYHYNAHKSIRSLIAPSEKDSGPQWLLDNFFYRDYKADPMGRTPLEQKRNERYYAGIQGGVKLLRTGKFSNILANRSQSPNKFRLRTLEEDSMLVLNGREKIYNLSMAGDANQALNLIRKEIPSLFEAMEKRDQDAAMNTLLSYIGNLPDTPEARRRGKEITKLLLQEKFGFLETREFDAIYEAASNILENRVLSPVGSTIAPYRLATGEIAASGMKVLWKNNMGYPSIGIVNYRILSEYNEDGNYSYSNYVNVKFSDDPDDKGVNLPTSNLSLVPDDTPLERGRKTVRNAQLDVERALEVGYVVDFDKGLIFDKKAYEDNGQIKPLMKFNTDDVNFNYIDYNKYGDQIIGSPKNGRPIKAKDIVSGDTLYEPLGGKEGTVKSVTRNAKNKEVSVEFTDGTVKTYKDDVNLISSSPVTTPAPAPLSPLGQKAKDVGIGVRPDGTADSVVPIHTTKTPATTTPVKDSDQVAVKPTEGARKIKNNMLDVGKEVRDKIDSKTAAILKNKGVSVSKTSDIDKLQADLQTDAKNKSLEATKAKADLESYINSGKKVFKNVPNNLAAVTNRAQAKLVSDMDADGFIVSSSVGSTVDKSKLSEALRSSGLNSLADRVDVAGQFDNQLFMFSYSAIKDKAISSRLKTLQKAKEAKLKARKDAFERADFNQKAISEAKIEAYKEVMKEEGVELDNVSLTEFDGILFTEEAGLPVTPESTFKSKVALEQTFETLPSSLIRAVIAKTKAEGKKIFIMSGVPRAHVTEDASGNKIIRLSNIIRPFANEGDTTATQASVHENAHVWSELLPNVPALAHAFQYDIAATGLGTPNEQIPSLLRLAELTGGGFAPDERALAVPGVAEPYMLKQYGSVLDPSNPHSEMVTMAIQDALTSHGVATQGKGLRVKFVDTDGKQKYKDNAYYDKKSNRYFTDSSMTTPIENVVAATGRSQDDGSDQRVRDFAYGLLFSLANRDNTGSATGGPSGDSSGTSIATPKPSASATSAIKKGIEGSEEGGIISSIIDKFSGSDGNLSRGELGQLINFLQNELEDEESSKYNSKEKASLRSYLNKIIGL